MVIPIEKLKEHVVERVIKEIRNAQVRLKEKCVNTDSTLKVSFAVTVVIANGLNAVERTTTSKINGDKVQIINEPESTEITEYGPQETQKSGSQSAQIVRERATQQHNAMDNSSQAFGRKNQVDTQYQQ